MSTNADCKFFENEKGQWGYKLQEWPYGEWPEYETYGPFGSLMEAEEHLFENHANPGGWSVRINEENHKHEIDPANTDHCYSCGLLR